jgi:phage FluMu gp28-like protein
MPYFLPYQRAWRLDSSRLKICQKSRQIGLTYVDSYDSVCKAAMKPGGRDVWVMSRDEMQARQYIRYCKRWANVLQFAAADLGQRVLRGHNSKPALAQVLNFASGASIYALSSNPDAIVGKTGHVKLDEFALHKDQRTLYAVAKPVIQWGGTLSVISTHRGAGTVFNELLGDILHRGNPMGWSLHTVPIQKAVEEGLVERILARQGPGVTATGGAAPGPGASERDALRQAWLQRQRAECIDEEQWLQEYCCVPADEAAAFISFELLTACTEPNLRLLSLDELINYAGTGHLPNSTPSATPEAFEFQAGCHPPSLSPSEGERAGVRSDAPRSTLHAQLFLGVDVARKKDLCVLDVGEKIGDVVWDRLRLEFLNRPFAEIEEALFRLLRLKQLKRACIDATGLGAQLAERARERFEWKVEPLIFTTRSKEDLATGLKIDMEKRHLRLADDDRLRADLRGIRKEATLSGNSRYAGEADGSHCDRFWAKALRQYAARFKTCSAALVG